MPEQAFLHGRINSPDTGELVTSSEQEPTEAGTSAEISIASQEEPQERDVLPKSRFASLPALEDEKPFRPLAEQFIYLGASMAPQKGEEPVDNQEIPSGYTFVALFLDHDITFDPVAEFNLELFKPSQSNGSEEEEPFNFRTPRIDMDSVYGRGPRVDRYLYNSDNPNKLLIGNTDGVPVDVPRNRQKTAIIGDPRNDENLVISQMYLAFLHFHNAVVDYLVEQGEQDNVFEKAREMVIRHYQWIIRYDLLPRIVPQAVIDEAVKERKLYLTKEEGDREPYIPHEFAVAAYRFGHSQVREKYHLNDRQEEPILLFDLFKDKEVTEERAIDWSKFFAIDGSQPQYSRKIDPKITPELHWLPFIDPRRGQPPEVVNRLEEKELLNQLKDLAVRNLIRGAKLNLPSGEAVVRVLEEKGIDVGDKVDVPESIQVPETVNFPSDRRNAEEFNLNQTPLWFYILKEAEKQEEGKHLGKVGGRIVAEVILGLLERDPRSFVNQEGNWKPSLPSEQEGDFTAVDLIKFAGVRILFLTEPYQTGPDVRRVQEKLNHQSYIDIAVDGIYGPNTRDAVLEFQRRENLKDRDGIVGPETRGALGLGI